MEICDKPGQGNLAEARDGGRPEPGRLQRGVLCEQEDYMPITLRTQTIGLSSVTYLKDEPIST